MTDDLHFEPRRNEVRCDHGDGKGYGHPAPGVVPWAHACCGILGHCWVSDGRTNFDELPHGATGDWLIETEHGTRFHILGLGTDRPRWWRVPGSAESSQAYSRGTYRVAALRGRPDDEPTHGGEPVRVGHPFTIGQGFMSDLWHASRVVWIRRLTAAEAQAALLKQAADDD